MAVGENTPHRRSSIISGSSYVSNSDLSMHFSKAGEDNDRSGGTDDEAIRNMKAKLSFLQKGSDEYSKLAKEIKKTLRKLKKSKKNTNLGS